METQPNFKELGFVPGDQIVCVVHEGGRLGYYKVRYPNGYISKCNKEGKQATFLGILNSEDKL